MKTTVAANAIQEQAGTSEKFLEHLGWRNWIALLVTSLTSLVGLIVAYASLLRIQVKDGPWPWQQTEFALLVGLSLVMVASFTYLTLQQRQIHRLRKRLSTSEHSAHRIVERSHKKMLALHNLSRTMSEETDLEILFDWITYSCRVTFDCHRVSLMIRDTDSDTLEVRSAVGHPNHERVLGARQDMSEGVAGWVASTSTPLILKQQVDETDRFKSLTPQDVPPESAMVVPILVRDELVGVINVSSDDPEMQFDELDLQALEVFAWNVGLCIRYSELRGWMLQRVQAAEAGGNR